MKRHLIIAKLIFFTFLLNAQTHTITNIFKIDPVATSRQRNNAPADRILMYKLLDDFSRSTKKESEGIKLSIPTFEGSKTIQLRRVNILSENFKVTTESGNIFTDGDEYEFYQGYIYGNEERSIVGLSVRGNEINLLISDDSGDFQVSRFDKNHFIGFYNNELKEQQDFICSTNEIKENYNYDQNASISRSPSSDCVDVYFEIDYAMYNKKGQSLSATTDWMLNIFNHVSLQYNREGIPVKISEVMIHTTPDPYVDFTSSSDVLYEFRRIKNSEGFNGRLAHFLSGRGLGGGVAWLNVLCSTYSNYAVSGNLNGGAVAFPNYSWNVMVISHEMGHNFGSSHTQDCVWNGNNTAIDGCVTTPGSCGQPPVPQDGGTIMSYCHLNAVGINLAKGFGPQPGAKIYNNFVNANCILSQDCSDVPPVNDLCHAAIEIFPSISCIKWSYHNRNSTVSDGLGNFTCDPTQNPDDVWFRVTIPVNGKLNIETSTINNGLNDLVIETYTGDCFELTLWECDNNSGSGNHALINIDDLTKAGEEIFIRLADVGSDEEGEFSICAYTEDTPCNYALTDSLLAFYNSLNGNLWSNNDGWQDGLNNSDCDYCQWYGVVCNNKSEIIGLELNNNNLSGNIPATIDTFIELKTLNISNNSVGGEIPVEIGNLTKLNTLDISHNNYTDTLPNEIRNLRELRFLDVSNNQFYGSTPQYIGYYLSKLNHLDMSSNDLSGCFDNSLTNFCDLEVFTLIGNPLLPYSGDVSLLCSDGYGIDSDQDLHCANIDDCNDNESASFYGNPEICDAIDNNCDGIIDEGFENLQNTFLGLNTDWTDATNWSLGHTPLPCEEVIIGMDGTTKELIIPQNNYGIKVKGLKIGGNASLTIDLNSNLDISSTAVIENHGTLNIYGYIYSNKTDMSVPYGIKNFGQIIIDEGSMDFGNHEGNIIINEVGGYIQNKGYIGMYMFQENPNLLSGIVNYGIIDNHKGINIYGTFQMAPIILKANSILTTKSTTQWDRIEISN